MRLSIDGTTIRVWGDDVKFEVRSSNEKLSTINRLLKKGKDWAVFQKSSAFQNCIQLILLFSKKFWVITHFALFHLHWCEYWENGLLTAWRARWKDRLYFYWHSPNIHQYRSGWFLSLIFHSDYQFVPSFNHFTSITQDLNNDKAGWS